MPARFTQLLLQETARLKRGRSSSNERRYKKNRKRRRRQDLAFPTCLGPIPPKDLPNMYMYNSDMQSFYNALPKRGQ